MSTNSQLFTASDLPVAVLGLVAAAVVVFTLSGRPLPLIADDRAALIALGIVGLVMCTLGGVGKVQSALGWAHPITIVGSVFGVVAMAIVGLSLLNVKLPAITTDRSAIIALAIVMLVKAGLSGVSRLIA